MSRPYCHAVILAVAVCVFFSTPLFAQQSSDQVHIGRDIYVQPQDKAGDLVCVACSIHIRGQVAGDVVAVGGSVALEQNAQIAGSVTTVAGSVRLEAGAQIAGDVTAVAGALRRDPQATIRGDITALGGAGWTLLALLAPLALFGGIVALLIWLFQRRRPVAPAAA